MLAVSPSADDDDDSGLSAGAMVGIAIAGIVVLSAGYMWMEKRKRSGGSRVAPSGNQLVPGRVQWKPVDC